MNPLIGFGVGWSAVAWYVFISRLILPALQKSDPDRRLAMLLAPQMFRHVSVLLLLPGTTLATMPAELAWGIFIGDALTAVLAVIAVVAVMGGSRRANLLAWLCTIVGLADLLKNLAHSAWVGGIDHFGPAVAIPVMGVPFMAWMHVFAIRELLRRTSGSEDNEAWRS